MKQKADAGNQARVKQDVGGQEDIAGQHDAAGQKGVDCRMRLVGGR